MQPAIYCRVSTDLQSVDMQRQALAQHLQREGVAYEACAEYVDEGWSGKNQKRPAWEALNKALHEGAHDTVYIYSLSRAGRSAAQVLTWLETVRARDVRVVFIKENYDLSTPMGRLALTIMAGVAEMEREQIAERTKEGIKAHRHKGAQWGGAKVIDPSRPGCRRFTDEEEATIAARARETSVKGAAREFKCHPLTVQRMLKRAG